MARSNIIEFARSFQESFQRQQQLELQRQREERFDRQLTANAGFRQADLNIKRQQLDLQERQFGGALPGRFGVAAQLKESGITGTALTAATQNIPLDLNQGEAEGFLLGSDESVLPFFEQGILGFGKMKFGKQLGVFNVNKEEAALSFKKFLKDTNFAEKTLDQQTGILRAFEESLGISETDGRTAVSKAEVDFDLQSEFFQKIIAQEKGVVEPKTQKDFEAIPSGTEFIDDDGKIKVKR